MDRTAQQYKPECNAGWEWRIVHSTCGGRPRVFIAEVLWVSGEVKLARPLLAPMPYSADLLTTSLAAMAEAISAAKSRPAMIVDASLVDWRQSQ